MISIVKLKKITSYDWEYMIQILYEIINQNIFLIKYIETILIFIHDVLLLHVEARYLLLESCQAINPASFPYLSNRLFLHRKEDPKIDQHQKYYAL